LIGRLRLCTGGRLLGRKESPVISATEIAAGMIKRRF
jgi:hypothetical protein